MNEDNKNDDVLVLSIKDRERMLNGHLQKILKLWQSQEWQFDEEQLIAFENGMKIGYELAYKDMSEISTSIAGVEEQVENIFKKGEQTMDYEKEYKSAIERAKGIMKGECEIPFVYSPTLFGYLFPELKESEDEKIRKRIIATISLYYGEPLEDEAKEMIDWLEKQSKENMIEALRLEYEKGNKLC